MTSMRQEPLVTSADEPLLLDSYLAEYDVAEVHACIVNGDVKTTWEAIRNADLSSIPVVHSLLVLRSLPGRLRAINSGQAAPAPPPFSLGDMPRVGFQLLGERPAEIAFGFVGKPWKVGAEQPLAIGRDDFAAFSDPGYAKVAFSIRAKPYGTHRTLITTETRTATTDAATRRRFAAYWKLISPFSALIRRLILRQVTSHVETPTART
jgi:hypothetical protein